MDPENILPAEGTGTTNPAEGTGTTNPAALGGPGLPGTQTGYQKPSDDTPDYEADAIAQGWKPEAEYKGPPGTWVDAETFVQRGLQINSKLRGELRKLQSQIASFEGTKAQFVRFMKEQMAAKDREHKAAIDALRIQRSEASSEGNHELAVELEDRLEAAQEARQKFKTEAEALEKPETPPQTDLNPIYVDWVANGNSWIQKDSVLAAAALAIGTALREEGDTTQGRAFYNKVKEAVMQEMPERFQRVTGITVRPSTEGVGQSGTGSPRSGSYNATTERDLSEGDRKVMDQLVNSGLITKEQFLKDYRK